MNLCDSAYLSTRRLEVNISTRLIIGLLEAFDQIKFPLVNANMQRCSINFLRTEEIALIFISASITCYLQQLSMHLMLKEDGRVLLKIIINAFLYLIF